MRRAILGLTIAAGLLAAVGVTSTAAGPTPSTTVVLSCDHGTAAATVEVGLKNTIFDAAPFDTVVLSCGPDSISGLKNDRDKVFTGSAGWFDYHIVLTDIGGCVGGSVVPATFHCDPTLGGNPGAKLVVR